MTYSPELEPDTAAWKSVNLVSEAWDLAGNVGGNLGAEPGSDGSETAYPMTRMEIRRAAKKQRRHRRKKRMFRKFMLFLTTMVFAAGVAAGGYLAWQQFADLTPQKWTSEVGPAVSRADATIGSAQILVAQVSVSEVPSAYQIVEARTAQRSFVRCARRLESIEAPYSRRLAKKELVAGCHAFADAMGTIVSAGGSDPLVNMWAFSADLNSGNKLWKEGTLAANVAGAALNTGT